MKKARNIVEDVEIDEALIFPGGVLHMKILLAENNFLIAIALEDALVDAGHEIMGPAISYKDAMDLIATDTPDLGFLNIDLSGAETGIDLARDLYAKNVPSVYVSGNTLEEGAREFAIGLLAKPYEMRAVIGTVEYIRCRMAGIDPPALPRGLVLFRASERGPANGWAFLERIAVQDEQP